MHASARWNTRSRGDAGATMLTASLALLVFLAFLLFSVQLLLNLYETSTVTSTAYEGARMVASSDIAHETVGAELAARDRAEQKMRSLLGPQGSRADFDWSGSTPDQIVLRVQLDTPRFTSAAFGRHIPNSHIDRTVRVRVERLR